MISFFLIVFILFLAVLGLHCCVGFSSSCGKQRLLSSCGARACCSGLSCCGAWALGTRAAVVAAPRLRSAGSVVVAPGLSCSGAFGISLDQDRTHVSCTGRWIPYHWAAREAPKSWFFKNVEKKYYGITAPKPQDTFFISLSQVSGFRRENSPL